MFSLVLIYLNSTARIYTPSVLKIINRSIQNLLKRPQPAPIDYCKVVYYLFMYLLLFFGS